MTSRSRMTSCAGRFSRVGAGRGRARGGADKGTPRASPAVPSARAWADPPHLEFIAAAAGKGRGGGRGEWGA